MHMASHLIPTMDMSHSVLKICKKKCNHLGKINWLPQRLKWMERMIRNFFISICCPCKVKAIMPVDFSLWGILVQFCNHTLYAYFLLYYFSLFGALCALPDWPSNSCEHLVLQKILIPTATEEKRHGMKSEDMQEKIGKSKS